MFAIGKTRKEQIEDFVKQLKNHYKRMQTPNRVNNMTLEMLKKDGKAPKLRAKGAETRYMVAFALEVATSVHAYKQNDHTYKCLKCISALLDFYMTFGLDPYPVDKAKEACREVVVAYVSLHEDASAAGKNAWAIKQKLHLFMELGEFAVEELGDPQGFWSYKDEDYVGLVSAVGESRGGPSTASTVPMRVVDRVRALSGRK